MKCRQCGGKLRVYRTLQRSEIRTRQYRRCTGCGARVTTEIIILEEQEEQHHKTALDYERVLTNLRGQMPRQTFDQWVKPTRLHFYNGNGRVVIAANNPFALDWLESRLKSVFERTLSTEIGHAVLVEFIVEE